MIQADILDLQDRSKEPPEPFDPDDTSIQFHCCHSPMREVQVLHDRLLDLFTDHPDLKPAVVLLDPEVTLGLPRALTAWTGVDALVHAIEVADRDHRPFDI